MRRNRNCRSDNENEENRRGDVDIDNRASIEQNADAEANGGDGGDGEDGGDGGNGGNGGTINIDQNATIEIDIEVDIEAEED